MAITTLTGYVWFFLTSDIIVGQSQSALEGARFSPAKDFHIEPNVPNVLMKCLWHLFQEENIWLW